MNSLITTLAPTNSAPHLKPLVSQAGFTCSLLTLAPDDAVAPSSASDLEEHFLFVVEGQITVRLDEVNTLLSKEEALLIPKDKAHALVAHSGGWAKVLRIAIPPRQVAVPEIVTFAN